MTYSISAVARQFGLSRSALLYYDSIGLLSPKGRSKAGYRVYTDKDVSLMREICSLREAGLPLRDIQKGIGHKASHREEILKKRLVALNGEIRRLRQQQRLILALLGTPEIASSARVLTKDQWIHCLRKAGLDEAGMERWHMEFERSSPEAHQDFLESLGISSVEVSTIREHSRKGIVRGGA